MVSNIFRVLISNGIVALVGLISSLLLPNLLSIDDYAEYQTILDKGIMPSEKVLDFPVDCNTLTGSVNL